MEHTVFFLSKTVVEYKERIDCTCCEIYNNLIPTIGLATMSCVLPPPETLQAQIKSLHTSFVQSHKNTVWGKLIREYGDTCPNDTLVSIYSVYAALSSDVSKFESYVSSNISMPIHRHSILAGVISMIKTYIDSGLTDKRLFAKLKNLLSFRDTSRIKHTLAKFRTVAKIGPVKPLQWLPSVSQESHIFRHVVRSGYGGPNLIRTRIVRTTTITLRGVI